MSDKACIVYLVEMDGQDIVCVKDGDDFHRFPISPEGLRRLAEEAAKLLRKHIQK